MTNHVKDYKAHFKYLVSQLVRDVQKEYYEKIKEQFPEEIKREEAILKYIYPKQVMIYTPH